MPLVCDTKNFILLFIYFMQLQWILNFMVHICDCHCSLESFPISLAFLPGQCINYDMIRQNKVIGRMCSAASLCCQGEMRKSMCHTYAWGHWWISWCHDSNTKRIVKFMEKNQYDLLMTLIKSYPGCSA